MFAGDIVPNVSTSVFRTLSLSALTSALTLAMIANHLSKHSWHTVQFGTFPEGKRCRQTQPFSSMLFLLLSPKKREKKEKKNTNTIRRSYSRSCNKEWSEDCVLRETLSNRLCSSFHNSNFVCSVYVRCYMQSSTLYEVHGSKIRCMQSEPESSTSHRRGY